MNRIIDTTAFGDGLARSVGLAIGDVLLILAFVVAGEIRHDVNPVAQPGVVFDTALPFVGAFLVAAFVAGLYGPGQPPRETALRTAGAWIAAAVIALALRATPLFHGDFAVAFLLVSIVVGLLLLVPWRVTVAYLLRRKTGTTG